MILLLPNMLIHSKKYVYEWLTRRLWTSEKLNCLRKDRNNLSSTPRVSAELRIVPIDLGSVLSQHLVVVTFWKFHLYCVVECIAFKVAFSCLVKTLE